jgi:hypothetical protein
MSICLFAYGLGPWIMHYLSPHLAKLPAYDTVAVTFRSLARSIGLRGKPGQLEPRIHDLRHTMAVSERAGFIRKQPRVARSIELLVDPKLLPELL